MPFLLDALSLQRCSRNPMRRLFIVGCALVSFWSCRLGAPSASHDFLLINLSLPRSATTSLAGVFARYRSEHEYMISETIHHLLDYREKKISKADLQAFLRQRAEKGKLQVDSASFFFLAPDVVIETFPEAYYIFMFRPCETWVTSMVDNSVFAHQMIREGKHRVDISFMDRYAEYFIHNHSYVPFDNQRLLPAQAEHAVANFAKSWYESTLRVLEALDRVRQDRKLVMRLADFSRSVNRLAQFVQVAPDTLIMENLHLNRDRDLQFYVRLLGAQRLERHCAPRQKNIDNYIREHRASFPGLIVP
jgi:hypothetical protein